MTAPVFTVREVRLYEREVRLRLPFRFGVVTVSYTHLTLPTILRV